MIHSLNAKGRPRRLGFAMLLLASPMVMQCVAFMALPLRLDDRRGAPRCAHMEDQHNWSEGTSIIPHSLLESTSWEDDRRPRRSTSSTTAGMSPEDLPREEGLGLPREKFFPNNEWGIHDAACSSAPTSATPAKKMAVTSHLPFSRSRLDAPEFPYTLDRVADAAVEAIQHSVQQKDCQGRISLEIDGTQHLQPSGESSSSALPRGGSSAGTLRRLALVIAQKLATDPTIHDQNQQDGAESERPVVVYLNTIKQTMLAAYEFQGLTGTYSNKQSPHNVTILTMGDDLPEPIRKALRPVRGKGQRRERIHPSRGFVVVVQPTDYNDEHQPPGPSIGTLEALQRLSAQASLLGLTTVLISPRFLASPYFDSAWPSSWRQGDGTKQEAAAFGGEEPGRQPTPWLLRDFYPPVLSWIGHGVTLSPPSTVNEFAEAPLRRYTRVALMQTGATGAWHVFGARHARDRSTGQAQYDYWASTAGVSGRPTRKVMLQIYEEFHD